ERIEIGVGRRDQRAAGVPLLRGNWLPLLRGGVLQVRIRVEEPIAGGGPENLNFRDLVVVDTQARAEHEGSRLVSDDHLGKRLTCVGIKEAAMMIDLQGFGDEALLDVGWSNILP